MDIVEATPTKKCGLLYYSCSIASCKKAQSVFCIGVSANNMRTMPGLNLM